MDLRWSRGCGTGIGLSAHKNEYPITVAINNFLEDRAAAASDAQWHRFGKDEPRTSTYRAAHNRTPEQTAADFGNCTAKIPREMLKQDKGKEVLFEHLAPRQKPPAAYVSLNSLAYSTPHLEKRSIDKELWCGHKAVDLHVSQLQPPSGQLTADKITAWTSQATPERYSKYSTAAHSSQMTTALYSDPRTRDCHAAAAKLKADEESGHQQPTIGRKIKGDMRDWVERKEEYINMLHAREPINYTVKLTCKEPDAESDVAEAKNYETACPEPGVAVHGNGPAGAAEEEAQLQQE